MFFTKYATTVNLCNNSKYTAIKIFRSNTTYMWNKLEYNTNTGPKHVYPLTGAGAKHEGPSWVHLSVYYTVFVTDVYGL